MVYHNFYTEKTGRFFQNYIPDDIYYNDINYHYNDFNAFKVVDNKANYDKLFPTINQPCTLATRKNGFWYILDDIVGIDAAIELLCREHSVFIKRATDCGGGNGVCCLENFREDYFRKEFTAIVNRIKGDIAVQQTVVQHAEIGKLNPDSVNTMRILSVLQSDGQVKVYSSVLRIGGGGAKVDNFCSGGMAVGIGEKGCLLEYGYFLDGSRITHHPVSGIAFKGYQLPSFDKALLLVKKAHLFVPHFRMVSWDVAIDENGEAVLIEANLADGQLDLHQLCNGPLFGEDTNAILDEVFKKKQD